MERNPARPLTDEERTNVDEVLAGLGFADTTPERRHLLPALHALQAKQGWLSPGSLSYLADRMGLAFPDVWGVATFYAMFRTQKPKGPRVQVCNDVSCRLRGGEALLTAMEVRHGPPYRFTGAAHSPAGGDGVMGDSVATDRLVIDWEAVPCLGLCDVSPAAMIDGRVIPNATVAGIEAAAVKEGREFVPGPPVYPPAATASAPEVRRLFARVEHVDPASLADYRRTGGYQALLQAIAMGPEAVIAELEQSGLLGRGGAAFPAARKWRAVASAPGVHWVVCNADESEPGTFKDRVLMENDPFAIIEAITIAALTVGAEEAFIYVRGEYETAAARLENAIRQAEEAGLLGNDVAGSGRAVHIEIVRGAGAYVCGEETALFNSIEGRRGEPRNKPPFPTEVGLFGGPTLINNVETLANVPLIIRDGAAAFRQYGTARSTGTKLFCVSGQVQNPGVFEVPFGTTLRQVLALAGGVAPGRRVQAVLCGGAAGTFLRPDQLDIPLTYEDLQAAGGTIGSGALMVVDDSVSLWQVVLRVADFFREESCGQCVPCRIGTQRQWEIVARMAAGRERPHDRQILHDLGAVMRDASLCGLGQTASNAVLSALPLLEKGMEA